MIIAAGLLTLAALFFMGFKFLNATSRQNNRLKQYGHWFSKQQPSFALAFGIALLICVIISTVVYYPLYSYSSAVDPNVKVKNAFWATTLMTGIAFFGTQLLLFYYAFRFRSKSNNSAAYVKDSTTLELIWTIVPAICFFGLFLWNQDLWDKISSFRNSDTLFIEVVGEQFDWKVRYGGRDHELGKTSYRFVTDLNPLGIDQRDSAGLDDFIPVQMHVPKGRNVTLILRSNDVIHSFYIPSFRTKMDAVPGMLTRMQFTALYSTAEMRELRNDPAFNYEIACAELCGRMHFAMKMILVIDEPKVFDAWYNAQQSWLSKLDRDNPHLARNSK